MKKNSIRQIFGFAAKAAEPEPGEKAPAPDEPRSGGGNGTRMNAAERLGRALLESLGAIEGVSEDELVDAVLENFGGGTGGDKRAEPAQEPVPETVREPEALAALTAGEAPDGAELWEDRPVPVPMRTGSGRTAPVDYSTMSAEQFARLRKLLKKANADGRRIKL